MSDKKIKVAVVGLGFGAEFLPIYQRGEEPAENPAKSER